jgi:hypothetical protein
VRPGSPTGLLTFQPNRRSISAQTHRPASTVATASRHRRFPSAAAPDAEPAQLPAQHAGARRTPNQPRGQLIGVAVVFVGMLAALVLGVYHLTQRLPAGG